MKRRDTQVTLSQLMLEKHGAWAAARDAFQLLVLLLRIHTHFLLVEVEVLLLLCPSKAWS